MPNRTLMASWSTRLQQSDHKAYEEVFQKLHTPLFSYAMQLTRDRAIAMDIVQNAFLKLWEKRATLDPNKSLKAWLYLIVQNLAYNHNRDSGHRAAKLAERAQVVENHPHLPDQEVEASNLQKKIHQWIDALPMRQKEALTLSRMQGLSHEEIAAIMDVSPRTVNNHIVRALKQLHSQIKHYEPTLLKS